MGRASYVQTSFLAGEFSPYYQGRMDDPSYAQGMNLCYNAVPIGEGAWSRRTGSAFGGCTRLGQVGVLRAFSFKASLPYDVEFTPGYMRFWTGPNLVLDHQPLPVLSLSSAPPAVLETAQEHGYSNGDEVEFLLPPGGSPFVGIATLINLQFIVTVIDAYHFSIAQAPSATSAIGSLIALGRNTIQVCRILTIATVDTAADLPKIRIVQNDVDALVLCSGVPAYVLTSTISPSAGVFAEFNFALASFQNGPYLDAPEDGSTATPSGVGPGSLTVTRISIASINNGAGFQSTDVGRFVNLFSEPAVWSSSTSYTAGESVKYNNAYYTALTSSHDLQPDVNYTAWAISTTAANWTWGIITAVIAFDEITLDIQAATTGPDGLPRADGPLNQTTPITTWQLGVWSATTGYPNVGTYYEGRFWLASDAFPNRFDATMSNQLFRFDLSGPDGTVADNSGISETFNSNTLNTIYWFVATHVGLTAGTQPGEWLIQASSLNDPITPTSIQAHRVTKFGCVNIEPRETPMSVVFVQRFARKAIEYIADVYSGKFSGTNISLKAKHLTQAGIAEIAYVQELTPIIWARTNDLKLIGWTYKRESPFATQPASFSGWHHNDLGHGRGVISIQAGPAVGGELDSLSMITQDPDTGLCYVEVLTTLFDEDTAIEQGWFVDGGLAPAFVVEEIPATGVVMYGYMPLAGQSLDVSIAGLDLGTYTVSSIGTITVPYGADAGGLFTHDFLAALPTFDNPYYNQSAGMVVDSITPSPTPAPPQEIQTYEWTGDDAGFNYIGTIDWSTGYFFGYNGDGAGGDAKYNYLKKFSIAGAGNVAQVAYTSWNSGFTDPITFMEAASDGKLYGSPDGTNVIRLIQVDQQSLELLQTFGSSSGLSFDSDVDHYSGQGLNPSFVTGGGSTYLAAMCQQRGYVPIFDVGAEAITWIGNFNIVNDTETDSFNRCNIVAGRQTDKLATIFGIAPVGDYTGTPSGDGLLRVYRWSMWNNVLAANEAYPMWVASTSYTVGQNIRYLGVPYVCLTSNTDSTFNPSHWTQLPPQGIRNELMGTLAPADIDPTWTKFLPNSPSSLIYDSTDDTVMGVFTSPAGPATTQYIVKWDCNANTLVWKTACANVFWPDQRSRCEGGIVNFIGSDLVTVPNLCYTLDTATGSLTTMNLVGVYPSTFGVFVTNDKTGYLIGNVNLGTSTPGYPPPVAPATGAFMNEWARVQMATGESIASTTVNYPSNAGYTYTSQGQILRPVEPQKTGTRTGTTLGTERRTEEMALLLANTQGISFGEDMDHLNKANFRIEGTLDPTPENELFSGVYWTTIDSDYTFDSMPCWQVTRPYP